MLDGLPHPLKLCPRIGVGRCLIGERRGLILKHPKLKPHQGQIELFPQQLGALRERVKRGIRLGKPNKESHRLRSPLAALREGGLVKHGEVH